MKEAAGAFTGDEEKKAEGQAQQRKGQAGEEAAQKAKTRQTEKEAKEAERERDKQDRKSTRLNSSHANISYAVFCLKKKNNAIAKVSFRSLLYAHRYNPS